MVVCFVSYCHLGFYVFDDFDWVKSWRRAVAIVA